MSTAQTVTLFPPGRTVACAPMVAVRFAGGGSSKAKSGPQPAKLQWLANTPAPPAQRVRSSAWTARSALRPRRSFKRASQLFQSGHPVVDFLWLQWRPVRLWSRFDVERTHRTSARVSVRCLCSDRSDFGKPLHSVRVVPADGGVPRGRRLSGGFIRALVETGSVVGQRQVEVGHVDVRCDSSQSIRATRFAVTRTLPGLVGLP
jgi:hypothetical protein